MLMLMLMLMLMQCSGWGLRVCISDELLAVLLIQQTRSEVLLQNTTCGVLFQSSAYILCASVYMKEINWDS